MAANLLPLAGEFIPAPQLRAVIHGRLQTNISGRMVTTKQQTLHGSDEGFVPPTDDMAGAAEGMIMFSVVAPTVKENTGMPFVRAYTNYLPSTKDKDQIERPVQIKVIGIAQAPGASKDSLACASSGVYGIPNLSSETWRIGDILYASPPVTKKMADASGGVLKPQSQLPRNQWGNLQQFRGLVPLHVGPIRKEALPITWDTIFADTSTATKGVDMNQYDALNCMTNGYLAAYDQGLLRGIVYSVAMDERATQLAGTAAAAAAPGGADPAAVAALAAAKITFVSAANFAVADDGAISSTNLTSYTMSQIGPNSTDRFLNNDAERTIISKRMAAIFKELASTKESVTTRKVMMMYHLASSLILGEFTGSGDGFRKLKTPTGVVRGESLAMHDLRLLPSSESTYVKKSEFNAPPVANAAANTAFNNSGKYSDDACQTLCNRLIKGAAEATVGIYASRRNLSDRRLGVVVRAGKIGELSDIMIRTC